MRGGNINKRSLAVSAGGGIRRNSPLSELTAPTPLKYWDIRRASATSVGCNFLPRRNDQISDEGY